MPSPFHQSNIVHTCVDTSFWPLPKTKRPSPRISLYLSLIYGPHQPVFSDDLLLKCAADTIWTCPLKFRKVNPCTSVTNYVRNYNFSNTSLILSVQFKRWMPATATTMASNKPSSSFLNLVFIFPRILSIFKCGCLTFNWALRRNELVPITDPGGSVARVRFWCFSCTITQSRGSDRLSKKLVNLRKRSRS